MSHALPKTRPVQSSEWMIAIRDYKFDLTVYEISVGSLYGTCGNWGQRVFLSDKAISDITGMTRRKASSARKTLLTLGLIEDIGQHGYQPSQREYRLTLPVEMPARRIDGDEPVEHTPGDASTALYGGDEPVEQTPCAPGAHPGEPAEHIRVSRQGTQELDQDLEVDLEPSTRVDGPSAKDQSQNQRPAGAGPSAQTQDSQVQEPGHDDIPSAETPSGQRVPAQRDDEYQRRKKEDAARRDQEALIGSAADRLRDLVRSAGTVLDKDARAELSVEDDLVWKSATASLMGHGEVKFRHEFGVGLTLTWIGRAA